MENAPCIRTCPLIFGLWRLYKSTHIGRLTHNGVGPGGTGKFVLSESFFNNAGESSVTAAWAAPSGTVEITRNHIHMLFQHYSTDRKQQLSKATLLGKTCC